MPIAIEGIVWYSEDLDRARAFYRDVLGLPLLLDEGHVIHFDAGTVRLAIHRCPPGESREAPEGFLVFGVDDLAAAYEELSKRGAVFLGAPAQRPYGGSPTCTTRQDTRSGCWRNHAKGRKAIGGWPRSSIVTSGWSKSSAGEIATRKAFRFRFHCSHDGRDLGGPLVRGDGLGDRPRDDDQGGPQRHRPDLRLWPTPSEGDRRGEDRREALSSRGPPNRVGRSHGDRGLGPHRPANRRAEAAEPRRDRSGRSDHVRSRPQLNLPQLCARARRGERSEGDCHRGEFDRLLGLRRLPT